MRVHLLVIRPGAAENQPGPRRGRGGRRLSANIDAAARAGTLRARTQRTGQGGEHTHKPGREAAPRELSTPKRRRTSPAALEEGEVQNG